MTQRERCTGCEACIQICSTSALTMQMDHEGFLYPNIDYTKCIKCGSCAEVCPELPENKLSTILLPEKCIAATHKDNGVLLQSSSGGAFHALASLMPSDSIIFGSTFDDELKVVHCGVKNKELSKLQKSKYVQSCIQNCYQEVAKHMTDNVPTLFVGTPCQIAGLRSYLKKEYDKLILVELICHGVGSPGLFDEYLNDFAKNTNSKVNSFLFRDKESFFTPWEGFYTTIKTVNGKKYKTKFNRFTKAYLQNLILRKSCYSCVYADKYRVSDIVIGDFWGIEKIRPDLYNKNGVSLIIPISAKGLKMCNSLNEKMYVNWLPLQNAFILNKRLLAPQITGIIEREKFYSAYIEKGCSEALLDHVKLPGYFSRILFYMPRKIKIIIKKIYYIFK